MAPNKAGYRVRRMRGRSLLHRSPLVTCFIAHCGLAAVIQVTYLNGKPDPHVQTPALFMEAVPAQSNHAALQSGWRNPHAQTPLLERAPFVVSPRRGGARRRL